MTGKSTMATERAVWLLLAAAVLLPTAAMSWFLLRGMASEREANQHRVTAAHRGQLQAQRAKLEGYWSQLAADAETVLATGSAASQFHRLLARADSVVILDEAGAFAYPKAPQPPVLSRTFSPADWERAQRLELIGDLQAAAAHYGLLAARSRDHHHVARALLGQGRCLAKADEPERALAVIQEELLQPPFANALDSGGRLITPAAQLLAIRLIDDPAAPAHRQLLQDLAQRVDRYDSAMPSRQRLFLMGELSKLAPQQTFPTQAAERLAQDYLPAHSHLVSPSILRVKSDLWAFPVGPRIVLLFRSDSLLQKMRAVLGDDAPQLLAPGVSPTGLHLRIGQPLSGWHLSLAESAPPAVGFNYSVTGLLILLIVLVFGSLATASMRSQLRLAQLKHTLVSTVSHELKTPLASTQMLVDTLLGELELPPERRQEYLRTISQENERLSRLVESFLTFSRMERNQHQFQIQPTSVSEIVDHVQASIASRIGLDSCDFAIENTAPNARVHADADAILSALLNLIENASKYTDSIRAHIRLQIRGDSEITFAVVDRGVGLSPGAAKAIFRQFYQVDQSLTREQDGCGLGLSIVRYIMNAHDTRIEVDSEPGKGSCFSFTLPAVRELI